jgi:ribosomal 50S subunit-associated protein YjgA (DUF615 family)
MVTDQPQQNIRRYAKKFREEHISRAYGYKMAGLQETPYKREFLDKSDAALDEFLALFPDTEPPQ